MLPHGAKLAPAPETGDKEFDFMFAEDARPRQTDLIRSFEILRSRRSAPYLGAERLVHQHGFLHPSALAGVVQGPRDGPSLRGPQHVRKWHVGAPVAPTQATQAAHPQSPTAEAALNPANQPALPVPAHSAGPGQEVRPAASTAQPPAAEPVHAARPQGQARRAANGRTAEVHAHAHGGASGSLPGGGAARASPVYLTTAHTATRTLAAELDSATSGRPAANTRSRNSGTAAGTTGGRTATKGTGGAGGTVLQITQAPPSANPLPHGTASRIPAGPSLPAATTTADAPRNGRTATLGRGRGVAANAARPARKQWQRMPSAQPLAHPYAFSTSSARRNAASGTLSRGTRAPAAGPAPEARQGADRSTMRDPGSTRRDSSPGRAAHAAGNVQAPVAPAHLHDTVDEEDEDLLTGWVSQDAPGLASPHLRMPPRVLPPPQQLQPQRQPTEVYQQQQQQASQEPSSPRLSGNSSGLSRQHTLQALKARRSRSVATSPSVPRHPHTSHHDHDPETNIWRNPRGSLDSDDGYTASSAATSSTPLSSLPSTQDTSLPTSSIASHEHDPGAAARVLGRAAAGWRDEADAPPPSVLPNEASELVTLVGYADRAAAADAELARSRGTSPGRPAAPAPVAGRGGAGPQPPSRSPEKATQTESLQETGASAGDPGAEGHGGADGEARGTRRNDSKRPRVADMIRRFRETGGEGPSVEAASAEGASGAADGSAGASAGEAGAASGLVSRGQEQGAWEGQPPDGADRRVQGEREQGGGGQQLWEQGREDPEDREEERRNGGERERERRRAVVDAARRAAGVQAVAGYLAASKSDEAGQDAGSPGGGSLEDDEDEYPVDSLAAAVLQRSRALLRERDAIQQRIQAALARYGSPQQQQQQHAAVARLLQQQKQEGAGPGVGSAAAVGGGSPTRGSPAAGAAMGAAAWRTKTPGGDPPTGGAAVSVGLGAGGGGAGRSPGAEQAQLGRGHGGSGGKGQGLGAATESGASAAGSSPAPWRERLKALLAQAGMGPGLGSAPSPPGSGSQAAPRTTIGPPTSKSPRGDASASSGQLPADPLEAWRHMRHRQDVAGGPAAGPAGMGLHPLQPGGPVGGEGAQMVKRFDGTMGAAQDLSGRHRTHVQGVLSDWMAQVADATGAGPSVAAAQVTGGWPVELVGQAQPAAGAAAAAATAAAGKSGTEDEDELPSVDALLARLAKRFGLAPGTAPRAAGGGSGSTEGGSGTTGGGSGGARMPSFWAQLAKASPSATQGAQQASGSIPGGPPAPPGAVLPTAVASSTASVALAASTSPPSKPADLPTQRSSIAAATALAQPAGDPQPGLLHAGVGPLSTTHGATSNEDIAIVVATPPHGSSTSGDSVDGVADVESFLSSPTELITPPSDLTVIQEPSASSRSAQGDNTHAHAQAPVIQPHPHPHSTHANEFQRPPDEIQDDEVAAQSSEFAEDPGAGAEEEGQWPSWLSALGVPRPVQVDQLPAAFRSNPPSAVSSSYDSLPESYSSYAQDVSQPGTSVGGEALSGTEDDGVSQPDADDQVGQQPGGAGGHTATASNPAVPLPDSYPALEEEASGVSTPGGRAIPESEFTTPVGQKGPRLGRGPGLWGAGTPGTPGSGSAGRASSGSFAPVLGSLLDQAVGGMLFADTPSSGPPSARSVRSPMTHGSAGASPLRAGSSSMAISPVDRRWSGEEATGSTQEGGGARTGAAGQGSGPHSRGGSPGEVGRLRQVEGVHAAADGREDAEGDAGGPPLVVDVASPTRLAGRGRGGLPGRVLRPETPEAASVASSTGARFAHLLDHTVTAALFGDSPASSVDLTHMPHHHHHNPDPHNRRTSPAQPAGPGSGHGGDSRIARRSPHQDGAALQPPSPLREKASRTATANAGQPTDSSLEGSLWAGIGRTAPSAAAAAESMTSGLRRSHLPSEAGGSTAAASEVEDEVYEEDFAEPSPPSSEDECSVSSLIAVLASPGAPGQHARTIQQHEPGTAAGEGAAGRGATLPPTSQQAQLGVVVENPAPQQPAGAPASRHTATQRYAADLSSSVVLGTSATSFHKASSRSEQSATSGFAVPPTGAGPLASRDTGSRNLDDSYGSDFGPELDQDSSLSRLLDSGMPEALLDFGAGLVLGVVAGPAGGSGGGVVMGLLSASGEVISLRRSGEAAQEGGADGNLPSQQQQEKTFGAGGGPAASVSASGSDWAGWVERGVLQGPGLGPQQGAVSSGFSDVRSEQGEGSSGSGSAGGTGGGSLAEEESVGDAGGGGAGAGALPPGVVLMVEDPLDALLLGALPIGVGMGMGMGMGRRVPPVTITVLDGSEDEDEEGAGKEQGADQAHLAAAGAGAHQRPHGSTVLGTGSASAGPGYPRTAGGSGAPEEHSPEAGGRQGWAAAAAAVVEDEAAGGRRQGWTAAPAQQSQPGAADAHGSTSPAGAASDAGHPASRLGRLPPISPQAAHMPSGMRPTSPHRPGLSPVGGPAAAISQPTKATSADAPDTFRSISSGSSSSSGGTHNPAHPLRSPHRHGFAAPARAVPTPAAAQPTALATATAPASAPPPHPADLPRPSHHAPTTSSLLPVNASATSTAAAAQPAPPSRAPVDITPPSAAGSNAGHAGAKSVSPEPGRWEPHVGSGAAGSWGRHHGPHGPASEVKAAAKRALFLGLDGEEQQVTAGDAAGDQLPEHGDSGGEAAGSPGGGGVRLRAEAVVTEAPRGGSSAFVGGAGAGADVHGDGVGGAGRQAAWAWAGQEHSLRDMASRVRHASDGEAPGNHPGASEGGAAVHGEQQQQQQQHAVMLASALDATAAVDPDDTRRRGTGEAAEGGERAVVRGALGHQQQPVLAVAAGEQQHHGRTPATASAPGTAEGAVAGLESTGIHQVAAPTQAEGYRADISAAAGPGHAWPQPVAATAPASSAAAAAGAKPGPVHGQPSPAAPAHMDTAAPPPWAAQRTYYHHHQQQQEEPLTQAAGPMPAHTPASYAAASHQPASLQPQPAPLYHTHWGPVPQGPGLGAPPPAAQLPPPSSTAPPPWAGWPGVGGHSTATVTASSGVWGAGVHQLHHAVGHMVQQPAAGMVPKPPVQGVLAGDSSSALGDGDVIVQMLKRRMDSCMEQLRSLERNLWSPPRPT